MKDLFILAGAGTNEHISTDHITRFLLGWQEPGQPRSSKDVKDATPFFRWLADQVIDAFPRLSDPNAPDVWSSTGYPTFEELLHIVERLTYLLNVHYYDMQYRRLPPYEQAFYELSTVGKTLKDRRGLSLFDILVFATNAVLDYVTEKAHANGGEDARRLVASIGEHFTPHLYSLNYDTGLAVKAIAWWTGFESIPENSKALYKTNDQRQVFKPQGLPPVGVPLFAQIHGSILFGWIEHAYKAPHWVIARYPEPPMPHKTPRRIGFEHWNDRTALPVMPLISGFRKGEKILAEPYASYYHFLRSDAFRCRRWLILGYGGGDPHINAVLESAADFWAEKLRVYVCNVGNIAAWLDDERRYKYDLRHKSYFLGKTGVPRQDLNECSDGRVLRGSECFRMSIDGHFALHSEEITHFLRG